MYSLLNDQLYALKDKFLSIKYKDFQICLKSENNWFSTWENLLAHSCRIVKFINKITANLVFSNALASYMIKCGKGAKTFTKIAISDL